MTCIYFTGMILLKSKRGLLAACQSENNLDYYNEGVDKK